MKIPSEPSVDELRRSGDHAAIERLGALAVKIGDAYRIMRPGDLPGAPLIDLLAEADVVAARLADRYWQKPMTPQPSPDWRNHIRWTGSIHESCSEALIFLNARNPPIFAARAAVVDLMRLARRRVHFLFLDAILSDVGLEAL